MVQWPITYASYAHRSLSPRPLLLATPTTLSHALMLIYIACTFAASPREQTCHIMLINQAVVLSLFNLFTQTFSNLVVTVALSFVDYA